MCAICIDDPQEGLGPGESIMELNFHTLISNTSISVQS